MHVDVLEYVAQFAETPPAAVLDIGGRDINGSPRSLFPHSEYIVLDALPGPGVDIAGDAAIWTPYRKFDLVLCTEVFEHTQVWRLILVTAFTALHRTGRIVVTCAGTGRGVHSGISERPPEPDEFYANLTPEELRSGLIEAGFVAVEVEAVRGGVDLHATGLRAD